MKNRRALRSAVADCLAELGDAPATVAASLHSYGVRGVTGRADDCPMARYLRALISPERSVVRVDVLEERLRVARSRPYMALSVTLPPAVRGFVHFFDRGEFPELVDHASSQAEAKPAAASGNGTELDGPSGSTGLGSSES